MNAQVYLSYNPDDGASVEAIRRRLSRDAITAVRHDLVVPSQEASQQEIVRRLGHFAACIVLMGESGLSNRQRTDIAAALERSIDILVVLLPPVDEPGDLPVGQEAMRCFRLQSMEDAAGYDDLIDAIKNPRSTNSSGDDAFRGDFGGAKGVPPESKAGMTEVFLGAASPRRVAADSEFVARFAAYTDSFRQQVSDALKSEAPSATAMMDLGTCQWKVGTEVTVSLSARGLEVDNSPQKFRWDGKWVILRFDVEVPATRAPGTLALKFNATIEGITVAALRPEIEVVAEPSTVVEVASTELRCPKTAFASYSTKDRAIVLNRVRSLQIFANIDVFVDCLSVRPGERWKAALAEELANREMFWLFWSRNAIDSPWVQWEWRKVLEQKGLDWVQPHPLEPADVAPPPQELAELQFGTAFERYMMDVDSSARDATSPYAPRPTEDS